MREGGSNLRSERGCVGAMLRGRGGRRGRQTATVNHTDLTPSCAVCDEPYGPDSLCHRACGPPGASQALRNVSKPSRMFHGLLRCSGECHVARRGSHSHRTPTVFGTATQPAHAVPYACASSAPNDDDQYSCSCERYCEPSLLRLWLFPSLSCSMQVFRPLLMLCIASPRLLGTCLMARSAQRERCSRHAV